MPKNILIISSSPKKGGNSDTLCNYFAKGAMAAGHNVKKIALREKNIYYCNSCEYCVQSNFAGCAIEDDMPDIYNKLLNAHTIVLATPTHFYTMCGQMKTFIDRCYAIHKQLKNKEFYLIITAADDRPNAAIRLFEEFNGFVSCLEGAKIRGYLIGAGLWETNGIKRTTYGQKAYNDGRAI